MSDKALYALSACMFAAIFLVSIIVYGGALSRQIAIGSALVCCMSQFVAQDLRAHKPSIGLAHLGFVLAIVALIAFCRGA